MFKSILSIVALLATTQAASQEIDADFQPTQPGIDTTEMPVINPDKSYTCKDDPVLVQGAEGDAQLFRDPARPDALKPMHAVGYEVGGCSLLVMTDGSLMRPEDPENSVELLPAQ